jgi:hypothetical protein
MYCSQARICVAATKARECHGDERNDRHISRGATTKSHLSRALTTPKDKDHLPQNMNDFSEYLTVDLESRRWIIRAIVMV